jgi:hypothetical protein
MSQPRQGQDVELIAFRGWSAMMVAFGLALGWIFFRKSA